MLLKRQGLTIERPARGTGMAVGAGAVAVALVLAVLLLLRALSWPISFPQFLALAGAGALLVLAGVFAFWTYACVSMRYFVDRGGITIRWGPVKHHIGMEQVQSLAAGRGEHRPRLSGLGWWGYHVGRGYVQAFGPVLFFSTHRSPEDLVYVRTAETTYALSPQDPGRFIAQAQRYQTAQASAKTPAPRRPGIERQFPAAHPIWSDGVAQSLMLLALAINLALWGYVFASYPDLHNQITIQFPPIGDITTLHNRSALFKVPATATAMLALNLLAALGFEWKERAATYLLLSGTIFFQALFCVAAVVAVANA